jgi:hypothetical protein
MKGAVENMKAIRGMGGSQGIVIEQIVVRDEEDMRSLTRGLYDENDRLLGALGRRGAGA